MRIGVEREIGTATGEAPVLLGSIPSRHKGDASNSPQS